MSFYHNSPDGYRAVAPSGDNVLTHPYFYATPEQREGLFYRTDIPIDLDVATERLLHGGATIQDYQYWVDNGWKAEHGTDAAVERFVKKLLEEHEELSNEVYPFENNKTVNAQKVAGEAGDVIWCSTALASVAMADIDSGFKNHLFRYAMGAQHVVGGDIKEPQWRPKAAELATKYDQLTVVDVESLFEEGFEPLPGQVMNVFDTERPENTLDQHLLLVSGVCAAIRKETEAQFGWYGADTFSETQPIVLPEAFRHRSRRVGELVSQLYLETAWIALQTTGIRLGDMMQVNVEKLTHRIATNTVDKADGKRDDNC